MSALIAAAAAALVELERVKADPAVIRRLKTALSVRGAMSRESRS